MTDIHSIEQRTDLVKASAIEIGTTLGGIHIASVADLARISDTLSRGEVAVPPHVRGKPGVCFALGMQAMEWGLPIMSVINKSYTVMNRGVERIAYESQLLHAVVEKNADLKGRLRFEILGADDDRRCKVWGTFKGEVKPHEYVSETLAKLRDARGKNEAGQIKGSPLWKDNPEVQLFYSASRQWARLFCPDVLLGAYTPEELSDEPVDVTPKVTDLAQRLKDAKASHATARGFSAGAVVSAAGSIIEGEANPGQQEADHEATEERGSGGAVEGRRDSDGGDSPAVDDTGGSPVGDRSDARGDEKPVEDNAASAQAEIFPPDRKPAPKGKGKRR